ncbi:polysaccharide biosynthesis protein [Halocynthiibacter styelae]|uniref:Polysaccharide biosynthesis protein n=1 Tax=Halocynthiibacter styelae TaxID=2761955 RepID=A0A8J7LKV6_9RHOB|nr:polysaccharide biosynthesis protein [Paenihalocynthiibacter styelae]MBI1494720.1 polysaccharide biosynthesis protein [Paenihalocynthiibacter styelae]
MTSFHLPTLDSRIVGRQNSFFTEDSLRFHDTLSEKIKGSRILVIGGAGSIGFHTLRNVMRFAPSVVHVIDHNENGLAEVIRALRSAPEPVLVDELLTLPFDYGGAPFKHWLAAQSKPYDYVLNFAALKHVRSEKDPYSILAMLETNVLKLVDLAQGLEGIGAPKGLFCVSTDKAANPSSMMGATKRLMEHALFAPNLAWTQQTRITSARFANVAMSNGSLLQSWQMRQAAGQPMACPEGCRRFFVSLDESGHLCTLAAFLGQDRSVIVPALDPAEHLVLLQDVATWYLDAQGLKPWVTRDEDEARSMVATCKARGEYPLLLTPLDTAGEKPYEEFIGAGESVTRGDFTSLEQIGYLPPADAAVFPAFIETLRGFLSDQPQTTLTEEVLKNAIATVEPAFAQSHRASAKSLDARV